MSELIDCLHAVAATANRVEHENRLVNRYTARDFTPFRFLTGWGEVPSTHMLAFFLNPDEDHGQGTLFQELFIHKLRALLRWSRLGAQKQDVYFLSHERRKEQEDAR